jgi:phosphate transport system substrate-binding protein
MKQFTIFISALAFTSAITSCGSGPNSKPLDTPTSGEIHITVDDSYRPMIEAEIEMFEALYVKTKIKATYTSERKAFEDLIADSSRLIVVNRELNDNEKDYFKQRKVTPKVVHIANDGLAFIVNNENPASKMLYSQVKDIFTGNVKSWKQLSASKLDSMKVIFDDAGSGNIRMIRETFHIGDSLPKNCFAVNSNEEVVKFVESNPNALGIISVNWISDSADSTAIDFLGKIKVLRMGSESLKDTSGTFYGPYQGYIANQSYPFIRKTYIVSREARSGLGTGFASFVASDKGQRIILRSGMVPAVAPVRMVNINTQ